MAGRCLVKVFSDWFDMIFWMKKRCSMTFVTSSWKPLELGHSDIIFSSTHCIERFFLLLLPNQTSSLVCFVGLIMNLSLGFVILNRWPPCFIRWLQTNLTGSNWKVERKTMRLKMNVMFFLLRTIRDLSPLYILTDTSYTHYNEHNHNYCKAKRFKKFGMFP